MEDYKIHFQLTNRMYNCAFMHIHNFILWEQSVVYKDVWQHTID